MEHNLNNYPELEITGIFSDPKAALEKIETMRPEVVFLDINMPQLTGMKMALQILDVSPETDIVFVTAYSEYALEAFEVHALDYILKPIEKDRLDKTIEYILGRQVRRIDHSAKKLRIKCFGRFLIEWEGETALKWRTEKTKELFAFLLYDHGRGRSKEELLYKLWTEDDPEKAIRQLYNGIYYIRKALEDYGVDRDMIYVDTDYRLRLGPVFIDVDRFRELENSTNETDLEEMQKLYCGPYFQGEDYEWAQLEQERLAKSCRKALLTLSAGYAEKGCWAMAEAALLKAYDQDPYEEEVTEKLLLCYRMTGNTVKAKKHLALYADLLQKELGLKPDAKLCELCK